MMNMYLKYNLDRVQCSALKVDNQTSNNPNLFIFQKFDGASRKNKELNQYFSLIL